MLDGKFVNSTLEVSLSICAAHFIYPTIVVKYERCSHDL